MPAKVPSLAEEGPLVSREKLEAPVDSRAQRLPPRGDVTDTVDQEREAVLEADSIAAGLSSSARAAASSIASGRPSSARQTAAMSPAEASSTRRSGRTAAVLDEQCHRRMRGDDGRGSRARWWQVQRWYGPRELPEIPSARRLVARTCTCAGRAQDRGRQASHGHHHVLAGVEDHQELALLGRQRLRDRGDRVISRCDRDAGGRGHGCGHEGGIVDRAEVDVADVPWTAPRASMASRALPAPAGPVSVIAR